MAEIGDEFKPGDKAPHSGIYDVLHDKEHAKPHHVTVIHGRTLPPCNNCGKGVTFRLRHRALHIGSDEHFKT